MSNTTDCTKGADMPDVWAVIVIIIILMVVYGYISSKISDRKKRKAREATIPEVTEALKTGVLYNVFLSDGRGFENVTIIGTVEDEDAQFSFANWEGMLVLEKETHKKIFIKKSSVRFIEEL
jgi:hypothetical protein